MNRSLILPGLAVLSCMALATTASADTVRLEGGRTLRGVKATVEGDQVRVELEHGSTRFPKSEVLEIVKGPSRQEAQDDLDQAKRRAGDDPNALRDLAGQAHANGLDSESDALEKKARAIELDRRLAELERAKTTDPYLELVHDPKKSFSPEERRTILERALTVDPDDAQVRQELGQVKRGNDWLPVAEARRRDAACLEQAMAAKGLAKFDGCWVPADLAEKKERERQCLKAHFAEVARDVTHQESVKSDAGRRSLEAGSADAFGTDSGSSDSFFGLPDYTDPSQFIRHGNGIWPDYSIDDGLPYSGPVTIVGPGRNPAAPAGNAPAPARTPAAPAPRKR